MKRWRGVFSLLLACAIAGGCSEKGTETGPDPGPAAKGTTPSPTPPVPAEAFAMPVVNPLPSKAADLSLRIADNRYSRLGAWANVGTAYMTMANPHAPADRDDEGTTIVRIADGKAVATYTRSAPNRRLYRVFFWGDTAIVQEITDIDAGEEGGRIHLSRYDLGTGTRVPLLPSDGRRLGYLSAAALAGNLFAVAIEKDGDKDRCLHVFDLATGTDTDATCLPPGANGIFSVSGNPAGFTYLTTAGATLASCRTPYFIALTKAQPAEPSVLDDENTCRAFDHAWHDGWSVLSTITAAADKHNSFTVAALRARNGTHTADLGLVDTNSTVSCGAHVYWRRPAPGNVGMTQVVRWKPGADVIEVVYQTDTSPSGDQWNLTFPGCGQHTMTIVRYRPGPKPPAAREVLYLPHA